ncbi:thioesterase domain-containing protein, partial [Streptomyces sp. NPDC048279]|uniref:thioesterase domain-containing protein n=1 Tax=Streptomyces sp. NPDC048279 TaxID=3154714 RepID=UPI00341DE4FF
GQNVVRATRRGLSRPGDAAPDTAAAAVSGLVRATQTCYPGRITLVDIGDGEPDIGILAAAVATNEPDVVLRSGAAYARRLVRVPPSDADPSRPADGTSTIVVAGSAKDPRTLAVAHHLASAHGAHRVAVVVPPRDVDALQAELAEVGVDVPVAGADMSDGGALVALAVSHCGGAPLRGVVRLWAGADGAAESLKHELAAAWQLHRAVADQAAAWCVFVLPTDALLGTTKDVNAAAFAAFLGALAERPHSGTPSAVFGWGLPGDNRTPGLGSARCKDALRLLDAVMGIPGVTVAAHADAKAPHAADGSVPPLLRALVRPPMRRAANSAPATGGTPRERLALLSPADRHEALQHLVHDHAAAVLGHATADALDPDRSLLEYGLESLAAIRLRALLDQTTGLRLPVSVIFEHPSVHLLARHLDEALTAGNGQDPATGNPGEGVLVRLFREGCEQGRPEEALRLLTAAAELAPSFTRRAEAAIWPEPVRLARNGKAPAIVCFPSLGAISGPHEYLRFASAMRGIREVSVLPHPGYRTNEPLPRTRQALVRAQTEALLEFTSPAPAVLLGRSSGGWIAHAVAEELERLGTPAAAVVLLDTFSRAADAHALPLMLTQMLSERESAVPMDDVRLTAMGGYLGIHADWTPAPLRETTALLVRAAASAAEEGIPGWEYTHEVTTVPGDHFSMLEEHASPTARAVATWLQQRGVTTAT